MLNMEFTIKYASPRLKYLVQSPEDRPPGQEGNKLNK